MESLYKYILNESGNSEIQDLAQRILDMFSNLVGSSKDLISTLVMARKEKKDITQDERTKQVERILFNILDDEEFYYAITHNANEYDVRRLLKQKLSKNDSKYILDIINYLDKVKQKY